MKLFKKLLFAIGLLLLASPFILAGLVYFGTNGGSAESWFGSLICKPIPSSVSNLKYQGTGGFDSERCFSFDISPFDLDRLVKLHSLEKTDEEEAKARLTQTFKRYPDLPLGNLDGYEAFFRRGEGIKSDDSKLFLISPKRDHVYCIVTT